MEKHSNILYVLILLLIVFQLTAFVFMSIQFSKLQTNIESGLSSTEENLTTHFTNLITSYDSETQRSINEISLALANQASKQDTFEEKISLIQSDQIDFSGVIEEALKGVVAIITEDSMGSGFILTSDGYVVTNFHVIQNGNSIRVLTHDKSILNANPIGIDRLRDLALLKIQGSFEPLKLANSDNLQVGNKVIAIGNPLGLSFTVTEGIISGLNREGPNGLEEHVQADAPLNPGNSGGPLLDTKGEVVGINNFKISGAESLGFALESNSIKSSVNSIAAQTILS
jgi:S1-C subfamily serine protease